MAYPASLDSYSAIAGTSTLASVDHANLHNVVGSAVVNIETTVGTTAGTNITKNFAAGDFPARINASNVLQQPLTGTITVTSGTFNNVVLGTPSVTGGTINTNVVNVGSDASMDMYYRNAGGTLARLPIGTPYQSLSVSGATAPTWAGTLVSAKVSLSTDQTNIPNGTLTKINFDSEVYDTVGAYTGGTVYKFIAPVNGFYDITAQLYFYNGVASGKIYDVYVYVNGTSIARGRVQSSSTQPMIPSVTTQGSLAANDYVEFYGLHDTGVGTLSVYASSEVSFGLITLRKAT